MCVVASGNIDERTERDDITVVREQSSLHRLPLLYQDSNRPFHPPWSDSRFRRRVLAEARRHRAEVIHAHGWSALSARKVCATLGLPLVVTLHDYGLLCPMRSLLRDGGPCDFGAGTACLSCRGSDQSTAKRLVLAAGIRASRRSGSGVTWLAVSQTVADRHAELGFEADIRVVPNFIPDDAGVTRPLSDEPRLLFVGPESPYKGFPLLRAALDGLAAAGRAIQLDHVGGPTTSADGVSVSWGRLEGTALEERYASCWAVAMPVLWDEPCPTVALEAMAAGRAIVGTRRGGLKELVQQGVTGLLVEPNNAAKFG